MTGVISVIKCDIESAKCFDGEMGKRFKLFFKRTTVLLASLFFHASMKFFFYVIKTIRVADASVIKNENVQK